MELDSLRALSRDNTLQPLPVPIPINQLVHDQRAALRDRAEFTPVQSCSFNIAYGSDENLVVTAPTGSGKTGVFELAFLRLLSGLPGSGDASRKLPFLTKIVYFAPYRALCEERLEDWQSRFGFLGYNFLMLTGDAKTSQEAIDSANFIITTPEKWDSLTGHIPDQNEHEDPPRNKLTWSVCLCLIDEFQTLQDNRGPLLEAIVAKLKTLPGPCRFVAVGAPVGNTMHLAAWLGSSTLPARMIRCGEDFRVSSLTRNVFQVQANSPYHGSKFENKCTLSLPQVMTAYCLTVQPASQRMLRPTMVFCTTQEEARKAAHRISTAEELLPFLRRPSHLVAFKEKKLEDCFKKGVAYHHAGLFSTDRKAVEAAFRAGHCTVVCCTTTLAIGINMPTECVVIKNTDTWNGNHAEEYSGLVVSQMMGRAGRSPGSQNGVAVIMTRQERANHWERFVVGNENLASQLHLVLNEQLVRKTSQKSLTVLTACGKNTQIARREVTSLQGAVDWLDRTFLAMRMRDSILGCSREIGDFPTTTARVEDHLRQLRKLGLVRGEMILKSTPMGVFMARHRLTFEMMKIFNALPRAARLDEILFAVADTIGLSDIRLKPNERAFYKNLNQNRDIRWPVEVDISQNSHKVSLLLQAALGRINLMTVDGRRTRQDQDTVLKVAPRIVQAIIDCALEFGDGDMAKNALELARSIGAKAWEDSSVQLQQIKGIGPAYAKKLSDKGVNTIEKLEIQDAQWIDTTLSRRPPLGFDLLKSLEAFPKLWFEVKEVHRMLVQPSWGDSRERIEIQMDANIGFLNERLPTAWAEGTVGHVTFLAVNRPRGDILHYQRLRAEELKAPGAKVRFSTRVRTHKWSQDIECSIACENISGTFKHLILLGSSGASWPLSSSANHQQPPSQCTACPEEVFRPSTAASFDDSDLEDEDLLPLVTVVESSLDQWAQERGTYLPNGNRRCGHRCKKGFRADCSHECCYSGTSPRTDAGPAATTARRGGDVDDGHDGHDDADEENAGDVAPTIEADGDFEMQDAFERPIVLWASKYFRRESTKSVQYESEDQQDDSESDHTIDRVRQRGRNRAHGVRQRDENICVCS